MHYLSVKLLSANKELNSLISIMKEPKKKHLIIFMPFIGIGGVEKNLFTISNYLSKKIDKISICTISRNCKKKFNKKIKFITPKKKKYLKK